MHHHEEIDARAADHRLAGRDHRRHGGTRAQAVLVDERQLGLVERIAHEANAEGIEHGFAIAIAELIPGGFQLHDLVKNVRIGAASRWFWRKRNPGPGRSRKAPQTHRRRAKSRANRSLRSPAMT